MKQAAGAEEDAEETVKTRAEAHSHVLNPPHTLRDIGGAPGEPTKVVRATGGEGMEHLMQTMESIQNEQSAQSAVLGDLAKSLHTLVELLQTREEGPPADARPRDATPAKSSPAENGQHSLHNDLRVDPSRVVDPSSFALQDREKEQSYDVRKNVEKVSRSKTIVITRSALPTHPSGQKEDWREHGSMLETNVTLATESGAGSAASGSVNWLTQ